MLKMMKKAIEWYCEASACIYYKDMHNNENNTK